MVKRFEPWDTITGMYAEARPESDGRFVEYDDYAELAAENERLKHDQTAYQSTIDYLRKRAEKAEALASTGAVKVKALDWTELSTGWIAHTSFHAYEVVKTDQGFMATYANMDFAWGAEDAMKIAAQADYERRILFALEPHPRATNPVDAHETANVSDKPEGQQEPEYTSGHCPERQKPGGCQLHNLMCGYPDCDRRVTNTLTAPSQEPVAWMLMNVNGKFSSGTGSKSDAEVWASQGYVVTPLFTRPSEQEVTEAAKVHIAEAGYHIGFIKGMAGATDEIREIADNAIAALKAAMEAGR